MTALAATVRDDRAGQRYELLVDGELAGELVYRTRDQLVTLIHTEVTPALEGRGLGEKLVESALDDIRARGLRIVPLCSFVAAFLRRHPEHGDLVEPRRKA